MLKENKAVISYQVWDDGVSPICFASLSGVLKSSNADQFFEEILSTSKKVSHRQRKRECYIIINLSSVSFSEDGLMLIKNIKKFLIKTYVKAVVVIGFSGMTFQINLQNFDEGPKMKWFKLFEEALGFVNQQIEAGV